MDSGQTYRVSFRLQKINFTLIIIRAAAAKKTYIFFTEAYV